METAQLKRITHSELLTVLVSAAVIGFIASFRDWGTDTLDVSAGVISLVYSTIIALSVLLLKLAVQKRIALRLGYYFKHAFNKWTMMASVVITFFANGLIPLFHTGENIYRESKLLRLGAHRYGMNYGDLSIIALAGPILSVLLMVIIKPLAMMSNDFFIYKIVSINAWIALSSMLPIPGNEGFTIFYYRRWLWAFCFAFLVVYYFLILATGIFSWVIAAAIATIALVAYRNHLY